MAGRAIADNTYQELYTKGAFQEAAEAAEKQASPESLAFAARSLLVIGGYLPDVQNRKEIFQKARNLSQQALAQQPEYVEAMLYQVIAEGFLGRLQKSLSPDHIRDAKSARDILYRALEIDQDNPWLHGTLAGWHSEIVRTAGATVGQALFQANLKAADDHYAEALSLGPDLISIRFEYVKFMLTRQDRPGEERLKIARNDLDRILKHKALDAFEKIIQQQAQMLMDALKTKETAQVTKALRRLDVTR